MLALPAGASRPATMISWLSCDTSLMRKMLKAMNLQQVVKPSALCITDHNQLALCLVRFHHPMGFTNVLKLEHPGRLCYEPALRHVIRDALKRDIRQGKAW